MAQQAKTEERLEEQIKWYDEKSVFCHRMYKGLKAAEILAGGLVPLFAGLAVRPALTGVLGVLIVVLEGLLQLNQYHSNWISYRSTCEALKHEKYLYAAKAGPYAISGDALARLAERIESLISQEHAKWVSTQEQAKEPEPAKGG